MNKVLNPKVLWVDDEPNILEAFKRQLRLKFDLDTATRGDAGLKLITEKGPYAIIVSDMHMPEMDGIAFLQRAQKAAPESVRMMLTGNADQESAVRAVNEGNIFRFINKPCSTESLIQALDQAAAQYRLIAAEKDLLQNTLSGSVKLLTDILSFIDPVSFGQSIKLRQHIKKVVSLMKLSNAWEIELAGMLASIGLVTVPPTLIDKARTGAPLSAQEKELIEKVPATGQSLIGNIPRLEGVSKIVLYQNKNFDGTGFPSDSVKGEQIPIGARIIKVLRDWSQFQVEEGITNNRFERMKNRAGFYDLSILALIGELFSDETDSASSQKETKIYEVNSNQLFLGQTLMANVETTDGVLLMTAGNTVSSTLLERIQNYSKFVGIKEPIKVDCLDSSGIKTASQKP